jgi:type II secretory pathway component PulF
MDLAIAALQRRGLVLSKIDEDKGGIRESFLRASSFLSAVTNADIVMVSRQITTLFEAQVSALRAFKLLASEARTPQLAEKLSDIANDIQGGSTISNALAKHPDVFSLFYVNMVKAGEESGKLDETFAFLADHLDRNYEITQKARNALVYPAFIMLTFAVVMTLMMTVVIPHLARHALQVGGDIPIYTKIVIGISNFLSHYIFSSSSARRRPFFHVPLRSD